MEVLDVSSGSGGWRADADGVGRKSVWSGQTRRVESLSALRSQDQNGLGRGGFFVRPLNLPLYQRLMRVPNELMRYITQSGREGVYSCRPRRSRRP